MYKRHPNFKTPDRDTVVWRYLSLSKFLSLLNEQQLYFARQDRFFDAQEGALSNTDHYYLENMIPGVSKRVKSGSLGCTFINCWVMSNVELYLMWTTYSSINEGVSIKTTVGNLIDSLDKQDKRNIYISDVKYIDHDTQYTFEKAGDFVNFLAPSFCKGKFFQQENELRLIHIDYDMTFHDDIFGLVFNVSLDTLIDEVWIAPKAEAWFAKVVQAELCLHNIHKPIKRSHIKTWNTKL